MIQPVTASIASIQSSRSSAETLPDAPKESVNYQILRRTLGLEDPKTPAYSPAAEPAELPAVSAQAASVSQAVASQRQLQVTVNAGEPEVVDPLVLDLAGQGFTTSGLQRSVRFDLDADGKLDNISVPTGASVLLALDRNGNGVIDNGKELFGDQHGARHGFAELARFDANSDGRIDAADPIFDQLSLLRFDDAGRQHLQSLKDAGVAAIELSSQDVNTALNAYDRIAQMGRFEFADGRRGQAADLLLAKR